MMKYQNIEITVLVTQRCNAKCVMCNIHENPSSPDQEWNVELINKLPMVKQIHVSGGEPFIRKDIAEIFDVLFKKAKRVTVNTNGYYTEKIVEVCKKHPSLAVRVSIDGMKSMHNSIRGIDIYDRAMNTVKLLKDMGIKDLGIYFTLQDKNYEEMLQCYHMANEMGIEFGVSVIHNSFYFEKDDNRIEHREKLKNAMFQLAGEQLQKRNIKSWARAFFNEMSIRYISGNTIPIHCDAGKSSYFIDAYGKVLPCNMTYEPWIMGDLREQSWNEIVESDAAREIRQRCCNCKIDCWSMCNVLTAMKKQVWTPFFWIIERKLLRKPYKDMV